MAQIIDSIVKISVNEAISTVSTTSVNTMAVVGVATAEDAPAYKVCASEDDAEVFGTDSALYGMVASAFAQSACPSQVVAIKADDIDSALTAVKAAEDAGADFYHIVLKLASVPTAESFTGTGKWNAYLEGNFKQLHVEVNDTSDGYATLIALADTLVAATSTRVALYQHAASGDVAASLVSYMCALDSARGQFSHKKVKNVTADSYSKSVFDSLTQHSVNVYVTAAGENRVFFGATCGKRVSTSDGVTMPATYIDNNTKDDWIRFNVQSKIYSLLGDANDGRGVTYDDAGINTIAAGILQIFAQAADTDHQYIMDGYSVDVKTYEYLKTNYASDVQARNLPLVKGSYARLNSINTVKNVELTVTL